MAPVDRSFFETDPLTCARALIGCELRWAKSAGIIVETEAYAATGDEAAYFYGPVPGRSYQSAQRVRFTFTLQLQNLGHHAVHVLDAELARVNDLAVWAYAAHNGYIIVSKDADFADLALLAQPKVRVIWVRIGNCRRSLLLEAFKNALKTIEKELDAGETLIELHRGLNPLADRVRWQSRVRQFKKFVRAVRAL